MDVQPQPVLSVHAAFRGINERLYRLDDAFGIVDGEIMIVCECAQRSCIERIVLPRERYEELRGDTNTAVVTPGHPAEGVRGGSFDGYELVRLRLSVEN